MSVSDLTHPHVDSMNLPTSKVIRLSRDEYYFEHEHKHTIAHPAKQVCRCHKFKKEHSKAPLDVVYVDSRCGKEQLGNLKLTGTYMVETFHNA